MKWVFGAIKNPGEPGFVIKYIEMNESGQN